MSLSLIILRTAAMAVVMGISACSITQKQAIDEQSQQAALKRWHQCIETSRAGFDGDAMEAQAAISSRCEGHQRDVVATYPEHLENQVNTLLSQRSTKMTAEHFLRSSNVSSWKKP